MISSQPVLHRRRSRSPVAFSSEPMFADLSRVYTNTFIPGPKSMDGDVTSAYLRRPLDPRPPKSPQFHRPSRSGQHQNRSRSSSRGWHDKPRAGMTVMVDHLQSSTPRPKSPAMNNEEPIQMSHYPDARKPDPNETPRIERDDFPAPPYPFADPERRRQYSESSKDGRDHYHHHHHEVHGEDVRPRSHSRDGIDAASSAAEREAEELSESLTSNMEFEDPQLKKEEEELSKIATGIGKVFLKEVKEREKLRAWKSSHVDPRNASRNPSARKELPHRLRYDNPVNASPSRDLDRVKPWDDEDIEIMSAYRSSGGKTAYSTTPAHSQSGTVSSLKCTPRPGYGTRPVTPVSGNGRSSSPLSQRRGEDLVMSKTHSIDFSSVRSDTGSSRYPDDLNIGTDVMSQCMSNNFSGFHFDAGYYGSARGVAESAGGYRGHSSASFNAHFRRSMPNVNMHLHTNEPAKMYPYYMLMTSNQKLPPHIDRCHLEGNKECRQEHEAAVRRHLD